VGLYVLASRVRVSPAGVSVRAWGLSERAVAWSDLRVPDPAYPRGPKLLTPRDERAGSTFAALFDRNAVVVYLGGYVNEGLLFDPPAEAAAARAGRAAPTAEKVP